MRVLKLTFGGIIMSKKPDIPTITFPTLCKRILGAVRYTANTVPVFVCSRNGCIRITAVPHCQDASRWLSPKGSTSHMPIVEYVYPIFDDGSMVINPGTEDQTSCFGFSALKTAHCLEVKNPAALGATILSGTDNDPQMDKLYTYDAGYAKRQGAVSMRIVYWPDGASLEAMQLFADIIVCVSGADQQDDLKCAMAAIPAVEHYLKKASSRHTLNGDHSRSPEPQHTAIVSCGKRNRSILEEYEKRFGH